jgi:threonine/homoserine/homoserine lactone efflux protein
MVWKGLKFGMLLQLAVGPMCLLVFSTATEQGLLSGLSLVGAIALIDALYIVLSGLGVAAFIGRKRVKLAIKIFGGSVLILFGLQNILGIFDLTIFPGRISSPSVSNGNIFLKGLLLTASNPLTIIFWSGVFSAQVAAHTLTRQQLFFFGMGCVLSTLIFLSGVALLGNMLGIFLSGIIIQLLNGAVGLVLLYFGVRLLFKK